MRLLLTSLLMAVLVSCGAAWKTPSFNPKGDLGDYIKCDYIEGGRIKLTLCAWVSETMLPPWYDVRALLEKVTEVYDLQEDYAFSVEVWPPKYFNSTIRGFWNPVGGGIVVIDRELDLPVQLAVIAHEIMHPILDAQGVPIMRHHCVLYTGEEFIKLEEWLRWRFQWKGIITPPAVRIMFLMQCEGAWL